MNLSKITASVLRTRWCASGVKYMTQSACTYSDRTLTSTDLYKHATYRSSHTSRLFLTRNYSTSLLHKTQVSKLVTSPQRHYCANSGNANKKEVSYEELVALSESGDVQLIDVREVKELEEIGKIPGALNIPLSILKSTLKLEEDKYLEKYGCSKPELQDRNIVFHALGSVKSLAALEIAYKLGYTKARHYPGGFAEWAEKNKKS